MLRVQSWRALFGLVVLVVVGIAGRALVAQVPADSADRLFVQAQTHYAAGRPDSALHYFLVVLKLRRHQKDQLGEVTALTNVGALYDAIGQRDSSFSYFRAALSVARSIKDTVGEAVLLSNIGSVFERIGQPDSALYYFRASHPLALAAGNKAGVASTLNNIGQVFSGIGQLDSALVYFRASLPFARSEGDSGIEAIALGNVGTTFLQIGNVDSSLFYFRASVRIARELGDRASEGTSLGNIGAVFAKVGQLDSAIYYHRASLVLVRTVGDRPGEAARLNNIGGVLRRVGERDSALYYYRQGLAISRALNDRAGEATALGNIGLTLKHLGQRDSALSYYRASVQLLRVVGDRQNEAALLANIADFYATSVPSAANRAGALAYVDSAAALSAVVRWQSGGDVNAIAFAESDRGMFEAWAKMWVSVALTETGAARDSAMNSALGAAERGRAQGLRDLLMRKESSRRRRQAAVDIRATPGMDAPTILAATDTIPGANLAEEAHRGLLPLRQSHMSLLYYLLSADSLTIWTLNPNGDLQLFDKRGLNGDSLVALMTKLRRGVGADKARGGMARGTGGEGAEQELALGVSRGVNDDEANPADITAAAAALSTELLSADLLRDVPAGSALLIVPHGLLGLIPFSALTVPGDTVPLGIKFALSYAPSLRAIGDTRHGTPASNTQLVVGDPAMPLVTDATGAKVRLRDLPGARTEGSSVAQRFGARFLTGSAATETVVRNQLPNALVVHLATHGLAFGSEARVRDSYVALAPDAENDGLLTIGELLDDVGPLSADLVVLSACQTGLGNLKQAEGTVGFQRAFLAKGAHSVLVSLWSVDDKATALLMDRFYAHWLGADGRPSSTSKAEALRRAQSEVRATKAFESPRYWAAFQLVGAR